MSPKYWVSSEDLSADSSLEGSPDSSRDHSRDGRDGGADMSARAEHATAEGSISQDSVEGALARTAGTNVTLPRLPNLQPQQHATLFYLSLIEGRCRTQAANTFNRSRTPEEAVSEDHPEVLVLAQHLFAEMRNELVKAGLLPEDFAASTLPDLRQYLDSFDNLLGTIATQRAFNISAQQNNHRALPQFEHSPLHSGIVPYNAGQLHLPRSTQQNLHQTGSLFESSLLTSDLLPYNPGPLALMAPREQQLQRSPPSQLSLFFPNVQDASVGGSFYTRDYKQIGLLGSGGFGKVYKAHYLLDGAEYAVKQIMLKASHLRYLWKEKKLDRIPREIKALARLEHHHISRYHHCWIESRPSKLEEDDTSENNSEISASAMSQSMAAITSRIESIQFGLERDLEQQLRRNRRATLTREQPFESSILFSNSGSSKSSKNASNAKSQNKSPKSMFRKPGDDSSSDEVSDEATDDVEEIPRGEIAEILDADDIVLKDDFVLFIKMTPYPLTLHALISLEDKQVNHEHSKIKHCFHPLPTVRLLLALLEGVEYLHRKNIIHRDLKPQNIFLAILDPEEKPTQGYINIDNCKKCNNCKTRSPRFVCPKIGDFGLIYELKSAHAAHSLATDSSPFVSSNVGTTFYSPPVASVPCAKMDVFSLGVIAFELLYQFKTETERRVVLGKLGKSGETPDDFSSHPMKEGIKKMVCRDVNRRWSTTLVREWLEGLMNEWE